MAPVLIVALVVGGAWERLFATWRKREASQGLPVIALLFTLSLPPTVPLWQVALGMSFGIVVGREVFGGTGKSLPPTSSTRSWSASSPRRTASGSCSPPPITGSRAGGSRNS